MPLLHFLVACDRHCHGRNSCFVTLCREPLRQAHTGSLREGAAVGGGTTAHGTSYSRKEKLMRKVYCWSLAVAVVTVGGCSSLPSESGAESSDQAFAVRPTAQWKLASVPVRALITGGPW